MQTAIISHASAISIKAYAIKNRTPPSVNSLEWLAGISTNAKQSQFRHADKKEHSLGIM